MKIINLTETQYKNYSRLQKNQNFGQTVEFSLIHENIHKRKLFLGLVDENNNIHAATLILIKDISPLIKEAIAPNGYLIEYQNKELLKTFTEELKKYLLKEKITYLITNPMFKLKVFNKSNTLIENNQFIYDYLIELGYRNLGYYSEFEKYDVILENYHSSEDIYKNFNRNTKRNIKEAINLGITLKKENPNNLPTLYNIFKKKTTKSLSYYQNLFNVYQSNDNKMEIFSATLSPHKFLINSKKLYEQELKKNEIVHTNFTKANYHITEKKLNKRITSDNILEKYHERLEYAIKLDQKYQEPITLGTCIVIRNNREIYFLMDGYNENYRIIHSTHILKWAIIKKYYSIGYRIFNLGEIHQQYYNKNNKYYGQYLYKIGFGGNIIEYSPNLLLIINKPVYNTYNKLKLIKLAK